MTGDYFDEEYMANLPEPTDTNNNTTEDTTMNDTAKKHAEIRKACDTFNAAKDAAWEARKKTGAAAYEAADAAHAAADEAITAAREAYATTLNTALRKSNEAYDKAVKKASDEKALVTAQQN